MFKQSKLVSASYLRNFVFGVEDSLVSTVGLLSGVAAVGAETKTIFLTGIILIFVEAFSMAVGSFLAERSAEDYLHRSETSDARPIAMGSTMFFSYFISGFIPLFPYVMLPVGVAFWVSISSSLAALFVLGTAGAKMANLNILRGGLRTLAVGGAATVVGILVGKIANGL